MYSSKLRQIAISSYKRCNSFRIVSSIIGISKSSIHRWTYNIIPLKIGRPSFDKTVTISLIKTFISTKEFYTINDIRNNLIYHNINLSLSFIRLLLIRDLHLSYKKATIDYKHGSIISLTNKISDFQKKMKSINFKNIVAIDETHMYTLW